MINRNVTIINCLLVLMVISSCARTVQKTAAAKNDCKHVLATVEKNLFYACPISKSPAEVVSYLDNLEGYVRNKEYDFGNGSIRYNAKNAQYYNSNLIDGKSLFLINYTIDQGKESNFMLFQAIYYFESEAEKDSHYKKMLEVLNNELQLKQEVKYDLLNNSYLRYYLPCKTAINIKQSGKQKEEHCIDILWGPY